MSRALSKEEVRAYVENRAILLEELDELQADFEDLSDEELLECRECMQKRIAICLQAVLEENSDNER